MSEPVQLARAAREQLSAALNALQTSAVPDDLMALADPIADAMSVLHRVERSNGADLEGRDVALKSVRAALDGLQKIATHHPATDIVMEHVALSLAKVHALAKYQPPLAAAPVASPIAAQQGPRGTMIQPAANPQVAQQPQQAFPAQPPQQQQAPYVPPQQQYVPPQQQAPYVPPQQAPYVPQQQAYVAPQQARPTPEPAPQARPVPQPAPQQAYAPVQPPQQNQYAPAQNPYSPAQQQQAQPQQAYAAPAPQPAPAQQPAPARSGPVAAPTGKGIDVELGTHSASNFYKGLGGNDVIEHGGIFVATYKVPKIGATVALRLLLPGDLEFLANAVVQWTREAGSAGESAEPGFGARFVQITPEGRQLVYRYTRNREPIFYDDL